MGRPLLLLRHAAVISRAAAPGTRRRGWSPGVEEGEITESGGSRADRGRPDATARVRYLWNSTRRFSLHASSEAPVFAGRFSP